MNFVNNIILNRLSVKPKQIFIAGWTASGSTFLYQVAKALGLDVKKIHGSRTNNSVVFTLYPYRDPRDIIISNARRNSWQVWQEHGVDSAILVELMKFVENNYIESFETSVAKINVFPIRYEDFFGGNERLLVRFIADKCKVKINRKDINKILDETSLQKNLSRSTKFQNFSEYDENTQIHGMHITNMGRSGGWKQYFSDDIILKVKHYLGSGLVKLGYEDDLNW